MLIFPVTNGELAGTSIAPTSNLLLKVVIKFIESN
jgi:hypothetical protein